MDTITFPNGKVEVLVDVRVDLMYMESENDKTGFVVLHPMTEDARNKILCNKLPTDLLYEAGYDEFVVASKYLPMIKEVLSDQFGLVLQIIEYGE